MWMMPLYLHANQKSDYDAVWIKNTVDPDQLASDEAS